MSGGMTKVETRFFNFVLGLFIIVFAYSLGYYAAKSDILAVLVCEAFIILLYLFSISVCIQIQKMKD